MNGGSDGDVEQTPPILRAPNLHTQTHKEKGKANGVTALAAAAAAAAAAATTWDAINIIIFNFTTIIIIIINNITIIECSCGSSRKISLDNGGYPPLATALLTV